MATEAAAKSLGANRAYALGLARATAGAVIFALPLLMTMEMWWLGFHIAPERLLLFVAANFAILVGLSRFGGFEPTLTIGEDVLDALAAYGVGILISALVLSLIGVLTVTMPLDEWAGKIAVQSVPASFGAMIARKQLGDQSAERDQRHAARSEGYAAELFLMLAGGVFLAFNVAPTEEMILIAYMMSPLHMIALMLASLLLLHALVYGTGFAGQHRGKDGGFAASLFAYTVPGYGIALLVSFYVLWTFGRMDGMDIAQIAAAVIVLGFPAAIGAAIARLVV